MNFEKTISEMPLARNASVVAKHESGLIAINKKAGLKTHPNMSGANETAMLLTNYDFKNECYFWNDAEGARHSLYLINRLDSPTSGIVLASLNHEVASLAKRAFKEKHSVTKIYNAIVFSQCLKQGNVWNDFLYEENHKNFVRVFHSPKGKKVETIFKFEKALDNKLGLALVSLQPLTGFTHQLRAQCSFRKAPILGDATYGDFKANQKIRTLTKVPNRLFLHCKYTKITFEYLGKTLEFEANSPLPDTFKYLIDFAFTPNINPDTWNKKNV